MSIYNMIFGQNPAAGVLCGMLGYAPGDFGRFRDAYIEMVDGEPQIAIYTRNGGGNRECWSESDEPCDCTGCVMAEQIPEMDGYLRDEDDDFDCTYATIYFEAPEKYREVLRSAATDEKPGEVWVDFLGALQDPPAEPVTDAQRRAVELIASLAPAGEESNDE